MPTKVIIFSNIGKPLHAMNLKAGQEGDQRK